MSAVPPQGADRICGFLGPDFVPGQALEDGLPGGRPIDGRGVLLRELRVVGVAPRPEAERPNERLDSRPDRRVGDAELPFHVAEAAPGPEEALEERDLLAIEAAEPPDAELALQGRAAAPAVEASHGQLVGADRTGGDHVVWHRRVDRPRLRMGTV